MPSDTLPNPFKVLIIISFIVFTPACKDSGVVASMDAPIDCVKTNVFKLVNSPTNVPK